MLNSLIGKQPPRSTKALVYYKNKNHIDLFESDGINVQGKVSNFSIGKNEGNTTYKDYLLSKNICCCIEAESLCKCALKSNKFHSAISKARCRIKNFLYRYLPIENASICSALIIGEKNEIDNETITTFSEAGLSHIIAISGMHTMYVASMVLLLRKKIGVRKSYILVVIILYLFCNLTYNSESVCRAAIMLSLYYIAKLIYRKSDSISHLFFAILICVIYNPFCVFNTGFVMSVGGTLGIVALYKQSQKHMCRALKYIFEQIKVSVAANIILFPIMAKYFNKFSIIFFISSPIINIIVSLIMPLLLCYSGFCFIHFCIPQFIFKILAWGLGILSNLLIFFAQLFQKVNIFNFQIKSPSIITMIMYYTIVYLIFKYFQTRSGKVKKLLQSVVCIYISICLITRICWYFDNSLKIYFIDVGQGDCTIIKTPKKHTIIIDGGGGEEKSKNQKIANQIVIPFLLNHSIYKIDYMIISHFDSDHVGGLLIILEKMSVKNVVISYQGEQSGNFNVFSELVKNKGINVIVVKSGDIVKIEPDLFFNILWPQMHLIGENILNNNSIVCKLNFKDFSMLFTGDIEAIAERGILELYSKNQQILRATCLKAAHHGSKTSSSDEFVNAVNPKFVVIGVGLNNKFGHPNDTVISLFQRAGAKVFRTDVNGQISIDINDRAIINIKKFCE